VNAVKQVLDLNQSGKSLENVEDDAKKVYKTFIDVRSAGKAKHSLMYVVQAKLNNIIYQQSSPPLFSAQEA
jgi:hypothetical protein